MDYLFDGPTTEVVIPWFLHMDCCWCKQFLPGVHLLLYHHLWAYAWYIVFIRNIRTVDKQLKIIVYIPVKHQLNFSITDAGSSIGSINQDREFGTLILHENPQIYLQEKIKQVKVTIFFWVLKGAILCNKSSLESRLRSECQHLRYRVLIQFGQQPWYIGFMFTYSYHLWANIKRHIK